LNDANDETLRGTTFQLQAAHLSIPDILPTNAIAHGKHFQSIRASIAVKHLEKHKSICARQTKQLHPFKMPCPITVGKFIGTISLGLLTVRHSQHQHSQTHARRS
jgi:hypothetical protein